MLARLDATLTLSGLFVRGGFHPTADDGVPPLPDGAAAGTVVLVGNAGSALWEAFTARHDETERRNPLDNWLRPLIVEAAEAVGAHPLFPNDGPPFIPIQDWAAKAQPVYRSPIGIMIHPDHGLWHVYRAALLFAQRLALPAADVRPSPCDACVDRPCLKVCPADAFLPDRFDAKACAGHVESAAGTACRERGCMARRACPVGRENAYSQPAQAFHTAAFLGAVRRGYGG